MVVDKRVLGVVGVIAGILALIAVFSPWVDLSVWGYSADVSAWDSITQATADGDEVEFEIWAILALIGAVLLLVPALLTLIARNMRMLWGILVMGGLIAIISSVWAFADIETGSMLGVSVSYGYGVYLTFVGGILGLAGILALRR